MLSRASWQWVCCQLAGQRSGPSLRNVLDQPVDRLGQLLALGRRGPHQPQAIRLQAQGGQRVLEHVIAPHGLVVLREIVAFAGVAAGDEHAVGPARQGIEDEAGVHPPAAHQADDADVGGVLDAPVPARSAAR